jgi:hypothetical protein
LRKSKLIDILSTFSKDETKFFDKFIASPYFSKERDVTALYDFIKKYHPDFDSADLDKPNVFKFLFPGESYNEKKLKNLSSELSKLAEQFLIHEQIRNSGVESEQILITQYRDRKASKLFFSTVKSLEKKLDCLLIDEYGTLKNIEEAAQMKAHFYFWKNDFDKTIESELKYIEYFTLSFIMRFFKKLQSKQIITSRYNKEFENPLFEAMIESLDLERLMTILREKNYSYLWLLEIYYNAYKCSINNIDNEHNFKKLKELFYEHIDKFSESERQGLFIDLTHYCVIQKDEKGNTHYEREQFDIYKKIVENFSASTDYFNIVLYRSIVITAINLEELDWLENFMNEYTQTLKPEYRSNMENLVKANLNFARNNFSESLECLSKISYDIFLYKLDVKNLLLKNYYELDLFEQAYSLIDAYKHFLSGTKEYGALQKSYYTGFVNVYNKLIKTKESGKYDSVNEILTNPEFKDGLPAYKWLKEKAEELKAK